MISKNGLNLAFKWFDSCSGTSKWSNFAWPNKRESPRDSYISAHLLSIDLYSAEVWTIQILIKAFQWRRVNGMTSGCAAKWPNRRQSPRDSARHSAACHPVNLLYCWCIKADPYAPYISYVFRSSVWLVDICVEVINFNLLKDEYWKTWTWRRWEASEDVATMSHLQQGMFLGFIGHPMRRMRILDARRVHEDVGQAIQQFFKRQR